MRSYLFIGGGKDGLRIPPGGRTGHRTATCGRHWNTRAR